jgi:flagellar motor switch/type III secretory pathway protein FliN
VAESENKLNAGAATGMAASSPAQQTTSRATPGSAEPQRDPGTALVVREEGEETAASDAGRDTRLDRLPMQVDAMVRVRSLRVADLLNLTRGSIVETVHDHGQDVPLSCAGTLLVWGEFESVEQNLAVRITRLA